MFSLLRQLPSYIPYLGYWLLYYSLGACFFSCNLASEFLPSVPTKESVNDWIVFKYCRRVECTPFRHEIYCDIVFAKHVLDLDLPTIIGIVFAECYCLARKCGYKVRSLVCELTWMSMVFLNITNYLLGAEIERQIERQK